MAQPSLRYDRRTRILHWTSALLVAATWLSAQVINLVPKGPPCWNVLGGHMTLGIVLGIVLAYRIRWRLGSSVHPPVAGNVLVQAAARAMHVGLYAALVVVIVFGLFNAWVRGVHVFTWFSVPAFDPGNKGLRQLMGLLHITLANYILIAAALHGLAALAHHFVLRDGTLHRMWAPRNAAKQDTVD